MMGEANSAADYRPSDQEPYMNPRQLSYFRQLLTEWRRRLWREERGLMAVLQSDDTAAADPLDHGVQMAARDFDLTAKLRNRQLVTQINAALERIEDGSYGYCLESGEEIGLRRLEILPFATLSVECQEQIERSRRNHRTASEHESATGAAPPLRLPTTVTESVF